MYKTKKVLSVAIAGATVASLVAASAAVADAVYENFNKEGATYGVIGDLTEWSTDIPMADDDGDGIYTAQVSVPEAGGKYKVRANADWAYSWGAVNADGVTANSQDNCVFAEEEYGTDVTVYFDTRGNVDYWTVSTTDPSGSDPYAPTEPSDPTDPSTEPSKEPSVPAGKYAAEREAAIAQLGGEDKLANYYFFDNSETLWGQVGAYWWTPAENAPWPGAAATQIEGTNIWAIEYNPETTAIIFNNLVSDADYSTQNPKAQTVDAATPAEAGMIYVPDMSTEEVTEEGAVKKYDGSWVTFEGEVVEEPSSEPSNNSKDSESSNKPESNPSKGKDNGKGVSTGDSAPIAIAAVFAAAALTAVVLTKKKVSSK